MPDRLTPEDLAAIQRRHARDERERDSARALLAGYEEHADRGQLLAHTVALEAECARLREALRALESCVVWSDSTQSFGLYQRVRDVLGPAREALSPRQGTGEADADVARAEKAESHFAAVAHAAGYCHEADGHACHPADVETVVAGIRRMRDADGDRRAEYAERVSEYVSLAAEAEREAIVAWLRGPLSGPEGADIADAIERGEHNEGGEHGE